ncbi:DUF707 domain-containing protein [Acidihalobacter aeolianus]|uniref:DUF707 domain-containing protein n=1 Tax=Acidihalobacter aeolianus TaxID=2792603 RepID=UPI0009F179D2|nr:DUF707 domain-containing protein [Acidihalobacter aeolianus]
MNKYMMYIKDFWTIFQSKLFQHRAYARVYWGKKNWYMLSLLHYVLRGEKKGYIPCPFFDPDHKQFNENNNGCTNKFAEFIRGGCNGDPSDIFDAAYVQSNLHTRGISHNTKMATQSIWLRYVTIPYQDRPDPAEKISLSFVTGTEFGWPQPDSSVEFSRRIMEYMQHKKQSLCANFAKNTTEYHDNIENYHNSRVTTFSQMTQVRKHDYLLYIQTNGNHNREMHHVNRNYDILLAFYEGCCDGADSEYCVEHKGTKITAISAILKANGDLIYRYKYVLFLDDDVFLSHFDINNLFEIADKNSLKLCQASLSKDSHTGLKVLYHVDESPYAFRFVSGVEIMMPLFSTDALKCVEPLFANSISGWGLDIRVGITIRDLYGETVAVVDSVQAVHKGVPNLYHGAYYKLLYSAGIMPKMELMYHVGSERPTIYEIH